MSSEPVRIVYNPRIQRMERGIKRRGLWRRYVMALGFPGDPIPGVPEEREVLLGFSLEQRRAALRRVLCGEI